MLRCVKAFAVSSRCCMGLPFPLWLCTAAHPAWIFYANAWAWRQPKSADAESLRRKFWRHRRWLSRARCKWICLARCTPPDCTPLVSLDRMPGCCTRTAARRLTLMDRWSITVVCDIDHVDARLLRHLIAGGYVPVIAPFTADASQNILNTNADTVAASIAVALGAEKLFFVVKAPGLLSDPNDPTTLQPLVDQAKLAELEARGAIQDGMKPKIAAARSALAGGVKSIHIVSGLLPDAILAEVFTNEGSGTMFVMDTSV